MIVLIGKSDLMKAMEKLIRKYEEGYKKIPETIDESIAWERASLTALTKEEW